MRTYIRGSPDFDGLEDWQKSLLLDPLVEVIKDFYKNPANRLAYEKWVADGKPMPNLKKQEVVYEQLKMSV